MSNEPIQKGNAQDFAIGNCRATFACSQTWSILTTTENAAIRSCNACQQQVFLCRDMSEVAAHVKAGHCIAVGENGTEERMFVGKMETEYCAGERLVWE